ncbi:MAG TPA: hypothetical protein VJR89_07550, partial [Polyangiales bacterium]|nr:hypothetical protein [Polyangiales bacterium]
LGQPAEAAAAIERMLREYAVDDNPLLLGLLHETAAECALRLGDCPRLTTHLGMLEVLLRSTANPVLIAYTVHVKQQLEAAAVAAGLMPRSTQLEITLSVPAPGSAPRDATYQLGELSAAPDRPRYALELLIQHTQARGGCLYLLDGSSLLLAAASVVDEPPRELEQELLQSIQRTQHEFDTLDDETRIVESMRAGRARHSKRSKSERAYAASDPTQLHARLFQASDAAPANSQEHRLLVLTARRGTTVRAVGGVILTLEPGNDVQVDTQLLHALADAVRPMESQA